MIQIIDRDTAEQSTPQVNNATSTKTHSTLHRKIIFKYAVALLSHSPLCILSHLITPDSTSNGSNSTGQQGTSSCNLKRFLVTLSIAKNNKNLIAFFNVVYALMKVIHGIEGDANKVKISP